MFVFYMSNYDKIVNPATGKKVNITGKLGKSILENYKKFINVTSKPIYNQTGGAHQLQRMIAALLVEGGLTAFQNWAAENNNSHKDFNHDDTTARFWVHERRGWRKIPVKTRRTQVEPLNFTSYSGRARTKSYHQRRQTIQKIKHSGDIHIDGREDTELLQNNSLFYHYDPTNTFSTNAQALLDDFIIDYVLNIHGTDPDSPHYTEFMNIFSLRSLYEFNGTPTDNLFFTSRYKQANARSLSVTDTTKLRYSHGHKKASVPNLRLGADRDQSIITLSNFPAAAKIYNKYNAAMPGYETLRWVHTGINMGEPLTLEEYNSRPFVAPDGRAIQYNTETYDRNFAKLNFRSWIRFLIDTRSNTHRESFNDEDPMFTKAWVAEDIVREIYLQSIFDALINLSDYKKRRTWDNYYKHGVDDIVQVWNTGERGAYEQVPVRTYKYINNAGHNLPQQMTTIQRPQNNGAILMNFNEFKAEYLHFNPTVNPNAQGIADDEKTRRLNWINQAWVKTIGINKRNILFNQIYNLPTNFNVNKNRQIEMQDPDPRKQRTLEKEYFPKNEQHAFVTRAFSHGETPLRQRVQQAAPRTGRRGQQVAPRVVGSYQIEPPRVPPEADL